MKSFIQRHFPELVITFFVVLIAALNYSSGTFLTGGDNLHPEFNFWLNLKRSFFAAWQEYQGLGLLGGMGHSADLLRELLLLPFSAILSIDQIRWFWTFITLFVGTLGAYFLLKSFFMKLGGEENSLINKFASLTGALFYLLNLSTVQSYFTPFEVFTAHFAFLPWLLLVTINFFEKQSKKNYLLLALVLFLSTPAAYVPTLFLVYSIASAVLGIFIIRGIKNKIAGIAKFTLISTLVNSFWLLPFLFFTFTNVSTNIDAKINQMATDKIYLQNKEFGHVWDVALLKGFWFNNVEPDLQGKFDFMLHSWKNHIEDPFIGSIGIVFFILILFGIYLAFKKRNKIALGFVAVFTICILMLATATPPFSWLNDLFRHYFPIINQIFRFAFTKFSILASLTYAFFFAFTLYFIFEKYGNNFKKIILINASVIFLLIVFSLPTFQGKLFYQKEKISIPSNYFKAFDYFNSENPNARIANFPQHTFWGWNFYRWGYSGSGFIWYGIPQPILDRTFDVWSKNNENYYWELNFALYSKNPEIIKNVLNKYDINYLLLDKDIISPASPQSLFENEFKDLISNIPEIHKEKEFGNIEIYKVSLENQPNNFVSSLKSVSSANSYAWSNYDQAFIEGGNYSSNEENKNFYPFRDLFTGKSQNEIAFTVKENSSNIEFQSELPEYTNPVSLKIPSLISKNNTLPVSIYASRQASSIRIYFQIDFPEIYLEENGDLKKIWGDKIEKNLFQLSSISFPLQVNINGVSSFEVPVLENGEQKLIGTTSFTMSENNSIFIANPKSLQSSINVSSNSLKDLVKQAESITLSKITKNSHLILRLPKLDDNYSGITIDPVKKVNSKEAKVVNCDNFRKEYFSYFIKDEEQRKLLQLSSRNSTPCISFYLPSLDHDQGYILTINNRNIKGEPLHFWVLNEDQKTALIDTYFENDRKNNISTIILPPMEKFGKAYSLHFDNASIGKSEAENLLGEININPIPYYFITGLKIENSELQNFSFDKQNLRVQHPNPSLYLIELSENKQSAISLSQSFSPYWKAYEVNNFNFINQIFPFLGKEVTNHFLLNNWKNGWIIDQSSIINHQSSIAIVYLPQYLEYLGFFITVTSFIVLYIIYLKKRHLQ